MQIHKVIQPAKLNSIHIHHTSPVYKVYYDYLKEKSSTEAAGFTREFCHHSRPSRLEDQLALAEFLYMNDFFKELEHHLKENYMHKDVKKLYRIILDRKKRPLTVHDIKPMEELSFEHPSLKCLHLFLLVYAHYDIKKYAGMDKFTEEIQTALFTINEPLFHYYMKLRFDELAFQHYWKANHLVLARKFAYKYINSGLAPRKKIMMHHNLALCYSFENYEASMDYAEKTVSIAKTNGYPHAAQVTRDHTIPFISAFHQKSAQMTSNDPTENAHLLLSRGQREEAISILSTLPSLTPFQQSYLGLAERNLPLLRKAKDRFINDYNDHFFAQLPDHYMKRVLKIV
ncbi:AimR family lysis-lysogeny pheromone receptor [Halobacillus sp. K22]|uniref:AimR family lysis-lysogeny pheromone receptor n=1 Tax=Halobacillus sp. K22 TaxID=3457431 RepID=UPI003FCC4A14